MPSPCSQGVDLLCKREMEETVFNECILYYYCNDSNTIFYYTALGDAFDAKVTAVVEKGIRFIYF